MNKKTVALTTAQYKEIIQTMKQGFCGCRPNERIATALMLEANLGIRISDILKLRLADIVRDGDRYRLSIIEKKTGKARVFTVPFPLYQFIRCYCLDNGIAATDTIFPLTERKEKLFFRNRFQKPRFPAKITLLLKRKRFLKVIKTKSINAAEAFVLITAEQAEEFLFAEIRKNRKAIFGAPPATRPTGRIFIIRNFAARAAKF